MKLWREEQKVMTLYKTIKGRTRIPNSHILMWMQSYCEGKNRKSWPLLAHIPRREKGRIGKLKAHIPMWKQWSCKGKNRNPRPYVSNEYVKGRTETQNLYTLKSVREEQKVMTLYEAVKGRIQTQDPILRRILRKGRTETQLPCTHIPMW